MKNTSWHFDEEWFEKKYKHFSDIIKKFPITPKVMTREQKYSLLQELSETYTKLYSFHFDAFIVWFLKHALIVGILCLINTSIYLIIFWNSNPFYHSKHAPSSSFGTDFSAWGRPDSTFWTQTSTISGNLESSWNIEMNFYLLWIMILLSYWIYYWISNKKNVK